MKAFHFTSKSFQPNAWSLKGRRNILPGKQQVELNPGIVVHSQMLASFPGFHAPECKHWSCADMVFFLTWPLHNKIGAEFLDQKGNVLHVVQPTMCLTLGVYNIRLPDNQRRVVYCTQLLLLFMFWVFGHAHPQLRSSYPLSTFDGAHVRKKYQVLHTCTTSMFMFWSVGAWQQG